MGRIVVGRKRLLEEQQGRCAYCGRSITLATMRRDHVEPLIRYRGVRWSFSGQAGCKNPGAHRLDNIVAACNPCNKDKGSMDLETWRASLRWPGPRPVAFWFERSAEEITDARSVGKQRKPSKPQTHSKHA